MSHVERNFLGQAPLKWVESRDDKPILAVALLALFLALVNPVPALAHPNFSFSIDLPFFAAVVGVPGPFYGSPPYGPPLPSSPQLAPPSPGRRTSHNLHRALVWKSSGSNYRIN